MSNRLKWYVLSALPVLILSLAPQARLWLTQGANWHGAYAVLDGDELLYSAYVNALMDRRPRRNDPFSGRDDRPNSPLPESTFSIQFLPAFIIAGCAKILGVSASTAFIGLTGIAAFLASVTIFWLLLTITNDRLTAAVGSLFVLCCGGLAAGQGLIGVLLNTEVSSLGLPFLRRYQPSATFFLFFVVCALFWRALLSDDVRKARLFSVLIGSTIAVLIFSYLYLWTAAITWLVCCSLIWASFRPLDRRRAFEVLAITGSITLFAMIPYLYLLRHRAGSLDETQTLISTHQPDLLRIPEIVGAFVLIILLPRMYAGKLKKDNPAVIVTISLALLPLILFNQQVITGRSMQPFHFENYIANYVVLVTVVVLTSLYKSFSRRELLLIASLCFVWGAVEVDLPARTRAATDVANDETVPVLRRLKELSLIDGTFPELRDQGLSPARVFSPQIEVLRQLPTWTSQGTMVGLGGLDFGSISDKEQKVFNYLYFCGIDKDRLAELLYDRSDDLLLNYFSRSAVFGHERISRSLTFNYRPIQNSEIEEQVSRYDRYSYLYSAEEASKHPMTYVVVRRDKVFDFSRVDRWYQRDLIDHVGQYDLYHLTARSSE